MADKAKGGTPKPQAGPVKKGYGWQKPVKPPTGQQSKPGGLPPKKSK